MRLGYGNVPRPPKAEAESRAFLADGAQPSLAARLCRRSKPSRARLWPPQARAPAPPRREGDARKKLVTDSAAGLREWVGSWPPESKGTSPREPCQEHAGLTKCAGLRNQVGARRGFVRAAVAVAREVGQDWEHSADGRE